MVVKLKKKMNQKKLKDDPWALKAIQYLVRMDYSSKEVIDTMVEVGIQWGGKLDDNQIKQETNKK